MLMYPLSAFLEIQKDSRGKRSHSCQISLSSLDNFCFYVFVTLSFFSRSLNFLHLHSRVVLTFKTTSKSLITLLIFFFFLSLFSLFSFALSSSFSFSCSPFFLFFSSPSCERKKKPFFSKLSLKREMPVLARACGKRVRGGGLRGESIESG